LGNSGDHAEVYQLDFAVNLTLTGGQTYDFFLNGPYTQWFTATSIPNNTARPEYYNAFLQASTGQSDGGADGKFLWLTYAVDINSPRTVESQDMSPLGGPSDANVQVFGNVPDGGSVLMLLGSSLAGLAFLRRRFGRC